MKRIDPALLAALSAFAACAQTPALVPFSTAEGTSASPPWKFLTVPKVPHHTRYTIVEVDGVKVLRSAARGDLGRWFTEQRDLRADFAQAFAHEARGGAPGIAAIALATDADNTASSALAFFGDIVLAFP